MLLGLDQLISSLRLERHKGDRSLFPCLSALRSECKVEASLRRRGPSGEACKALSSLGAPLLSLLPVRWENWKPRAFQFFGQLLAFLFAPLSFSKDAAL